MFSFGQPQHRQPVSALAVALAEALTDAQRKLVGASYSAAHDITNDAYVVRNPYSVVQDVRLPDGREIGKSTLIAALINLELLVSSGSTWIIRDGRMVDPQAVQALIGMPQLGLG